MSTVIKYTAKAVAFLVRLFGVRVTRSVIAYVLYKIAEKNDENRVREPLVRLILASIDGDERVDAAINYADDRLKDLKENE